MSKMTDFEVFAELFNSGKMDLSMDMYDKFSLYADLLCEWNEKINLTAITEPKEIAVKHFFDSVYPFTLINVPRGTNLIDVGTGAGFPSVPLKIYRPDIEITLLDSLNKRVNFLQTVSDKLSLDARCIHGRAEETARFIKIGNEMRECYDMATARAVANLKDLCEYCMPFIKVGGVFVALKGKDGETELKAAEKAIKILGGRVEKMLKYKLPNGDERTLIVITKISSTPAKYPRNAGQMKKNPL